MNKNLTGRNAKPNTEDSLINHGWTVTATRNQERLYVLANKPASRIPPEIYAQPSGPRSHPHLYSLQSVLPERKPALTAWLCSQSRAPASLLRTVPTHRGHCNKVSRPVVSAVSNCH